MDNFLQLVWSPAGLVMLGAGVQIGGLLFGWLIADVLARDNARLERRLPMPALWLSFDKRDAAAPRPMKIRALVVPLVQARPAGQAIASAMIVRNAA